jgi:hypothetical protein
MAIASRASGQLAANTGNRYARRKYIQAIKVAPKDIDSARIVSLIDELFAIDAKARVEKMEHVQRHALHMDKALALFAKLRTHAKLRTQMTTCITASIATGWGEPVPGRVFRPVWASAFSRRTEYSRLEKLADHRDLLQEHRLLVVHRLDNPGRILGAVSRNVVEFDGKTILLLSLP